MPRLSSSSTSRISSPARRPPQAVEVEHDQHVATAQVIEASLETGPVGTRAAAAVIIDALAASSPERVHLPVEHLPLFAGGHPRIADQLHRALIPTGSR